ncbi:hypothetical protein CPLU01_10110 [Colletotrichum plurivorum]|uniref:Uncharacterized protein n=1 Tax=Colletotrichum plurivorum TaxID=2175906 RepID=A0A8H6K604_9PEZI|nr:hypothetical protein CPLU01_10110 [Colletotrichum plurivorum]
MQGSRQMSENKSGVSARRVSNRRRNTSPAAIARWERDSGRHSIPPGSYATDATLGLLHWWTDDYEAFAFDSLFAGSALAGICDVKSSTPLCHDPD